jgi:hypothetical protein
VATEFSSRFNGILRSPLKYEELARTVRYSCGGALSEPLHGFGRILRDQEMKGVSE